MFDREDEKIEFLEETMDLQDTQQSLQNEAELIGNKEETLLVETPRVIVKKKKIIQFIEDIRFDFQKLFQPKSSYFLLNRLFWISLFLLPVFFFFYLITIHSNYPILNSFQIYVIISMAILIALIFILFFFFLKNRNAIKWKWKKLDFWIVSIFVCYVFFVLVVSHLFYGANSRYRDYFIQQVMNTTYHQYLANIFFNNRMIENGLSSTFQTTSDSENLYNFEKIDFTVNNYANSYEQEILMRNHPDDVYKIIPVEGILRDGVHKYSGYMAVVYDPSKVKLGTSVGAGIDDTAFGQTLSQIAQNYRAKVAINAGGFYDPTWCSNGGIPHGTVIQNGQVMTEYVRGIDVGGMIGFDENNRLILKRMSSEEALELKIRDAVDWGPFLIVNGVHYFRDETTKWACARTAIGQRKDGIVLLLVIDGDQPHSKGASYGDLADIMERYGAVNAANLDGGTSTSMVENYEYINIPFNGKMRVLRRLPNAWIVVE